jgi:secreted Zn-dependent insulinase-like peptidase
VLVSPHWTSVERQAALATVDRAAVADFARRYRARLYVQCLAQGNISQAQALAAAELVQAQLKYQPLNEEERPKVGRHKSDISGLGSW